MSKTCNKLSFITKNATLPIMCLETGLSELFFSVHRQDQIPQRAWRPLKVSLTGTNTLKSSPGFVNL